LADAPIATELAPLAAEFAPSATAHCRYTVGDNSTATGASSNALNSNATATGFHSKLTDELLPIAVEAFAAALVCRPNAVDWSPLRWRRSRGRPCDRGVRVRAERRRTRRARDAGGAIGGRIVAACVAVEAGRRGVGAACVAVHAGRRRVFAGSVAERTVAVALAPLALLETPVPVALSPRALKLLVDLCAALPTDNGFDGATACGPNANANGLEATAIGNSSNAVGDFATAVGTKSSANGLNATAYGPNSPLGHQASSAAFAP
jgi:trimeric autotransporter adhesin